MCVAVLLVGASLANVDLNALAAPDKSTRDAEAPPPPPAKRSVWGAVYAVRGIISGFVIVRLLFVPAIVSGLEALATATIPIPQARLGRAVLLISSGMPTAQIMIVLLHKFGLSQQASSCVLPVRVPVCRVDPDDDGTHLVRVEPCVLRSIVSRQTLRLLAMNSTGRGCPAVDVGP